MGDKFITNEVGVMLKTLSPDEARALLSKLKSDAIAAAKEDREQRESKRAVRVDPKKQKKYFKQYDEEVGALPDAYKKIRDELAAITGWKPGMGDCQLHFKRKPLGSQCLWSVKWHTSSGILAPDSFYPIQHMTAIQLLAEGHDISHPAITYAGVPRANPAIVEQIKIIVNSELPNLRDLKRLIVKCRGAYPEYIAGWSVPTHSYQVLVRPGWFSRDEIIAAMEKLRSDRIPERY